MTDTDIKTTFHGREDGSFVLEYEQDAEPLVEAIKGGGASPWLSGEREAKVLAELPVVVIAEWAKKHGMSFRQIMEDDRMFRRCIDDPDNRAFRIPG